MLLTAPQTGGVSDGVLSRTYPPAVIGQDSKLTLTLKEISRVGCASE